MLILGLDHIQIAAPKGCESAARHFLGQILGLEEIEKPEPLRARGECWFRVGDRQLHIGVEESFRPATKAHPAFAVSDIDAVFARLQQAGVHCTWDTTVSGLKRFTPQIPGAIASSSPNLQTNPPLLLTSHF